MSNVISPLHMPLDYQLLLRAEPSQIAQHLRNALVQQSEDQVSNDILNAVKIELIPPTVLPTWLSVVQSPTPIKHALLQNLSRFGRRAAIVRLGKYLRTTQWRRIWDALGGTKGHIGIFAELSVEHVRLLARAIGASSRGTSCSEKDEAVSELFKCLLPQHYPEAILKNPDARPLQGYYMSLLGSCSAQLVKTAIDKELSGLRPNQILRSHPVLLQELARQSLHSNRKLHASLFCPLLLSIPSSTCRQSDLPAPMAFSLSILKEVINNGGDPENLPLDPVFLCRLLLRRAMKKRLSWALRQAIVELLLNLVSKHHAYARQINVQDSLVLDTAECWSRSGDKVFLDQLLHLVRLNKPDSPVSLGIFCDLLRRVVQPKRYAMLQYLVKETLSVDIISGEGLRSNKIKDLPWDLLRLLRSEDAVSLIEQMIRLRPRCDFIPLPYDQDAFRASEPSLRHMDYKMALAHLRKGDEKALEICQMKIWGRMTRAQRSREQPLRAFYAETVLCYATLSRSLPIYEDALVWSKRYLKDPVTARSLYRSEVVANPCTISLLSGLHRSSGTSPSLLTVDEVRQQVANANKVLWQLFQLVFEAQREPSFQADDWLGVFLAIARVVEARLSRASGLQSQHGFTDDDMYSAVWEDTLRTLLDLEQTALASAHEGLSHKDPYGFLTKLWVSPRHQTSATLRFFDNLARARDSLWHEYRPTVYPAAAAIPAPFPRGLPIQCLASGLQICSASFLQSMHFIRERAMSVVFMSAQDALSLIPEAEEERVAIGFFVDEYELALKFCVYSEPTEELRYNTIERARSFLIDLLCGSDFMTIDEFVSNYGRMFSVVMPDTAPALTQSQTKIALWPELPVSSGIEEWNPQVKDAYTSSVQRTVKSNCLCCFLSNPSHPQSIHNKDQIAMNTTVTLFRPPLEAIWDRRRLRQQVPAVVQDGLILSALLYLDSKKLAGPRLLASSFPAGDKVRYPATYLDATFLDRHGLDEYQALHVLAKFSKRVPPTLLKNLAYAKLGYLSTLDTNSIQRPVAERVTFKLLKLFANSDRPDLARYNILRIVLDSPAASSWHRELLTRAHVNSLTANDARGLITGFFSGVEQRVDAQVKATQRDQRANPKDDANAQAYIKITTIKFLAQFLEDANFISLDFTLQSLTTLFHKARYIDARKAIVDDLLAMLSRRDDDSSDPMAEKLLKALESATPVIAAFNERELLTAREWQGLEANLTAPESFSDNAYHSPPILSALLNTSVPPKHAQAIISRIILPAVSESAKNCRRWARIVCRKYGAPLELADRLAIPFNPVIMGNMLNRDGQLLPASLLYAYHQWVALNIAPPEELAKMNAYLKGNATLVNSTEGKRWLQLFDVGPERAALRYFCTPQYLCHKFKPSSHPQGITAEQLKHVFDTEFSLLLEGATKPDHRYLEHYMKQLEPPFRNVRPEDRRAWAKNGRPLIELAIDKVATVRTRQWQLDPKRRPAVLPDTFEWETWLLPYPFASENSDEENQARDFAQSFRNTIQNLIDSRKTYHGELPLIHKAATRVTPALQARVGCALGSLDNFLEVNSTVPLLCIDVAGQLFCSAAAKESSRDTRSRSIRILEQWCSSPVEQVRTLGLSRMDPFKV